MENLFFEDESKVGITSTISQLEKAFKENGWGVLHIHQLDAILGNKGYEVAPARVMEICKPPLANQLLSADELRIYSNMMPCRISVYKKKDGKTYVSRMNNGLFAQQIGGTVEEVMTKAYEEVEEIVEAVSK